MVKKGYERVDVTFSKTSDVEMKLYKYIEEKRTIDRKREVY